MHLLEDAGSSRNRWVELKFGKPKTVAVGLRDGVSAHRFTARQRIHPAYIPHEVAGSRGLDRAVPKTTEETPALTGNSRPWRLNRKGRVELCKPEVTGSIPVRSISRNGPFAGYLCSVVPVPTTTVRARCERTYRVPATWIPVFQISASAGGTVSSECPEMRRRR